MDENSETKRVPWLVKKAAITLILKKCKKTQGIVDQLAPFHSQDHGAYPLRTNFQIYEGQKDKQE